MATKPQYSHIEQDSLNGTGEEIDVPVVSHYPSIIKQSSKRLPICLKICLAFLIIFLLLTISLCFVYASKGHPGFYWLGVGLVFLSFISGLKLHWMPSMDWDHKVKLATIAQGFSVIFLCMGLMAVMYGPKLKGQIQCSANTGAYYVGGYVTGLEYSGLLLGTSVLQINYPGSNAFTFTSPYAVGADYTVTVIQQPYSSDPSKPAQYCRIQNPTGTILHSNVTSISVRCG